jgi:hypothetical protein
MKKLKHQDLVTLYKEGEQADSNIYSEQRSNLMLVAGNHYSKKNSKYWSRVRDSRELSQESKIRLTKNHIQRICKIYENNILSFAPDVAVMPKNENELQDQKAAELNQAVWRDIKSRHNFKDRVREFAQDFVRIGEVCVKVFWDEMRGEFLGYEQAVDEMGMPVFDEGGLPVSDKSKPRFSGDLVFQRIFGFNMFRAREAKSMDESWFIGHRYMEDIDELKKRIGDDEERLKYVQVSKDETYLVFDGQNTVYSTESNQCMLMEVFVKPCAVYPKGYYYIYTDTGVLWEGELPYGLFPILYAGFDEVPTNPRHHSIIKVARPYQAELNRAASKIAETQITLGDDKLLVQAGSKIQQGGTLPGVRAVTYAGATPTVLPGRSGDQYLNYMQQQIDEMYTVVNLAEDMQEKQVQLDTTAQLFMSISQKKKYSIYSTKFESFLSRLCGLSLDTTRNYISEESLVPAIGRSEFINIEEFKNSKPLFYQIALEPSTEDMESKLGKHLMLTNMLQYVGSNLDPKDIGKLMRLSPYANKEQAFGDLTLDYDNANNMILSLDRGVYLPPNPSDDPAYLLKRITNRTRQADFMYLPEEIKAMYSQAYEELVAIQTEQQRKIQEAALGYIPMAQAAVPCDYYVQDPNNASKVQRARVPTDALSWLLKRLEEQGFNQKMLAMQQQGTIADIASKVLQGPPPQQAMSQGDGAQPMIQATGQM